MPYSTPTPKQIAKGFISYKISAGDTLTGIAKENNTTVGAILAINPQIKNPNKIYTNSALKIPSPVTNANPAGVVTTKVQEPSYTPFDKRTAAYVPLPQIQLPTTTLTLLPTTGAELTAAQLVQVQVGTQQGLKYPDETIAQYNKQLLVPKTLSVPKIVGGGGTAQSTTGQTKQY